VAAAFNGRAYGRREDSQSPIEVRNEITPSGWMLADYPIVGARRAICFACLPLLDEEPQDVFEGPRRLPFPVRSAGNGAGGHEHLHEKPWAVARPCIKACRLGLPVDLGYNAADPG